MVPRVQRLSATWTERGTPSSLVSFERKTVLKETHWYHFTVCTSPNCPHFLQNSLIIQCEIQVYVHPVPHPYSYKFQMREKRRQMCPTFSLQKKKTQKPHTFLFANISANNIFSYRSCTGNAFPLHHLSSTKYAKKMLINLNFIT